MDIGTSLIFSGTCSASQIQRRIGKCCICGSTPVVQKAKFIKKKLMHLSMQSKVTVKNSVR